MRTDSDVKHNFRQNALAELHEFFGSDVRIQFVNRDKTPDVTIVIVMYNEAELSLMCLRSIKALSTDNIEIILVDNHSTDDTYLLLRRLSGVTVIRNIEDLYFLRAANQAARKASGRLLLFINNDACLMAGSLMFGIETIDSSQDIAIVGGKLILPSGRLQEAGAFIWSNGDCEGFGRGDDPDAAQYQYRRDVDYCSGAYMLVRRDVFQSLGGFDQIYAPAYYEESDLCVRARKLGFRVVYDPRIVVDHYEFASASTSAEPSRLMQRNRQIFLDQHGRYLQRHHFPVGSRLESRLKNDRRPKVLIIEDLLPFESYGAGFPRTLKIVETLIYLGFAVQYYPVHQAHPDPTQDRCRLPIDVEFLIGAGRPSDIRELLLERAEYLDVLIVCRPANMKSVKGVLLGNPLLLKGLPLIYDAEALCAPRDSVRSNLLRADGIEWNPPMTLVEELSLPHDADCVVAVNEEEATSFRNAGHLNVHVVSTALVNRPTPSLFEGRNTILFVGRLDDDHPPNTVSIFWFIEEVLPKIRKRLGKPVRLVIAGTLGSKRVDAIDDAEIEILGPLNDLSPLFDKAKIFVAPTRFAAGIPLKVLEAAAQGVPAVISQLLIRQLNWTNGVECLSADHSDDFADACLRLMTDKQLWTRTRDEALSRVENYFSPGAFRQAWGAALASVKVVGSRESTCLQMPVDSNEDSSFPHTVTLVYLARGSGRYRESFDRFVRSCGIHSAGVPHDFVVLLKGFASQIAEDAERRRFEGLGAKVFAVSDDGLDIGAYIRVAQLIDSELICFLNTHSEILADGWLQSMCQHAERRGVGLVGATGSLEALESPGVPRVSFPNPHIRSNAFVIRRGLFLSLTKDSLISGKADAYVFESGENSLSRRIVGLGLETLIVDKQGRAYQPFDWVDSSTFRLGDQQNLLVADNQTRTYAESDEEEKRRLHTFAWGDIGKFTKVVR